MDERVTFLLCFIAIPMADGAIPGVFFWKPRIGIDLTVPTTESTARVQVPTIDNVRAGLVVLIDGYQAGMTVICLAAGLSSAKTYPHLNPGSAYYYTNVYRWALRYLSLIPTWLGGNGGNFCDTHKTWKRRFYYMDQFVPGWLRKVLPFVSNAEWAQEEKDFKKFKKYAEPAFGKHYRYPSKTFRNWASENTKETVENLDTDESKSN
ncbi:hypothetical protein K1T71_000253 [Dendrolimus kikuchii]|uniref:Uncharacterized protein n=1 Tax=Dendrolimus kikuchii TaxID=765133 RepID=A0ACC1DIZ3_9NEOP|nr:hypothetical protein K1T71_000253 [Dendrolimus kikuchii]